MNRILTTIMLFLCITSFAINHVGNGGDKIRGEFILKGLEVISFLEKNGKSIVEEFNLNLTKLQETLTISRIKVVENLPLDNGKSKVDFIGEMGLISLSEASWKELVLANHEIHYLIFHEMLRSSGVNDDNYVISKHLKGIGKFKKLTTEETRVLGRATDKKMKEFYKNFILPWSRVMDSSDLGYLLEKPKMTTFSLAELRYLDSLKTSWLSNYQNAISMMTDYKRLLLFGDFSIINEEAAHDYYCRLQYFATAPMAYESYHNMTAQLMLASQNHWPKNYYAFKAKLDKNLNDAIYDFNDFLDILLWKINIHLSVASSNGNKIPFFDNNTGMKMFHHSLKQWATDALAPMIELWETYLTEKYQFKADSSNNLLEALSKLQETQPKTILELVEKMYYVQDLLINTYNKLENMEVDHRDYWLNQTCEIEIKDYKTFFTEEK